MTSGSTSRGGLPPKLYFRIGEVSSLVGVEPHVLRYWEREFRSIRPTKSAKGQRVYSRRDVENLMRVRDLLYGEGFTIAGAKKKMQRHGLEPEESASPARQADQAAMAESPVAANAVDAPHKAGRPQGDEDARGFARMRKSLVELRGEIEVFLGELGTASALDDTD